MSIFSRAVKESAPMPMVELGWDLIVDAVPMWWQRTPGFVVEGVIESQYPIKSRYKGYGRALVIRAADDTRTHLPFAKGLTEIFATKMVGKKVRIRYDEKEEFGRDGRFRYVFTMWRGRRPARGDAP